MKGQLHRPVLLIILEKALTMNRPAETYMTEETYRALIAELARVVTNRPSCVTTDIASEIKSTLGLVGGIWPASIRADIGDMVAVPANAFPNLPA